MKKIISILLIWTFSQDMAAAESDTLVLNLQDAIRLAQQQSPSAQSAHNTFLSAYWNYRYY
ncbi:MAG: TolC family protein, partial [Prevotella sp.]|nr:TolC family protein [Prevotella sp.]